MPANLGTQTLAATGTTGNNTHAGVNLDDACRVLNIDFVVEAVGGTPTVSVSPQGSLDGTTWFAIPYTNENATTVNLTARAVTATGHYLLSIDMTQPSRCFDQVRIVTTANTNVTYSAKAYPMMQEVRAA